jgi:hypothetical protein
MILKEPSIPFFGIPHSSLYKHQFLSSTISLSPCSTREAIYLAKHLILLLLHLYPLYTILCLYLICHPVLDYHILYYNILYPLVLILPQLFVALVPLPIFALIISLLHHLFPISVVVTGWNPVQEKALNSSCTKQSMIQFIGGNTMLMR